MAGSYQNENRSGADKSNYMLRILRAVCLSFEEEII